MAQPFASFKPSPKRKDVSSSASAAMVKHHVRQMMFQIAADPVMLLEVVGAGKVHWRNAMAASFSPYPIPDGLADMVFAFFCQRVMLQFKEHEFAPDAEPYKVAKTTLDRIEENSPPTEADVRNAWKVEDFSSEDGKRTLYGTEAPQEHLARALAEMHDEGRA